MRRSILNKLAILFVLWIGYGCKARKIPVVQSPSPQAVLQEKPSSSKIDTIGIIRQSQVNFDTFSVKAKADIAINNKSNKVGMSIRMKKNEAIWVSVNALTIEIARVLITPDSIEIMNRVDNTYTRKPFRYIKDFTSDEVNFKMLQSILAGNCPDEFLTGASLIANKRDSILISGALNGLAYALTLKSNFRLTHVNLKDDIAKQQLILGYSGFQPAGGQQVPTIINVKSIAGNSISIDMEYEKVMLNEPVDMPFSVPKRFEVIN